MKLTEILNKFEEIAANPMGQKKAYLAAGKKVVLTAPVYTPEEIIHAMGMVPMAAWGADIELNEAKRYFPAFICSIMQSILELGMNGTYEGVSAIVIPSLCDSLKVLGENWKYGVPSIPFIPMTYPQNRKPAYGTAYTKAGYERVISDLEKATGLTFEDSALQASIQVYNEHNSVMRQLSALLAGHPEITTRQRSAVYKSAGFMLKEEHTALVKELIACLEAAEPGTGKIPVYVSGILADSPSLLDILDENGFVIAGDDVAAESRQYRTDAPAKETGLDSLAAKFSAMDNCSLLYDVEKKRVQMIVEEAKGCKAKGVIVVLTKFCDPEEFDYPLIKRACDAAELPCLLIEVDRQMTNYEQARTMLEGFKDMLA
jgi:benzoyl-CoA reductase/2-hydroxyglutaryl-CoA dehydratase subunit BcrC/BadD/HgdB